MNRSYQQLFMKNSRHGGNETTHLDSVSVVPVSQRSGIHEKTNPLFTPRPSNNSVKEQSISEKSQKISSKYRGELFSSRLVGEEEWHQLAREPKPLTDTRNRTWKLSDVMRQGPSLENGKLNLVSSYITEIDILPTKVTSGVTILYLSHNSLSSLINLQQFKYLKCLSISNNSLRYLYTLLPISSLTSLEKLSLEGNIVTHMPYYREVVIGLCSTGSNCSLEILDSIRISVEEKTNSRVNYKKCCLQLDQLRCHSLRVAMMDHMQKLFACHAELISSIVGRFRTLLGTHIDVNAEVNAPATASVVTKTLRYTLAGGVYRWLQITGGRDFEKNSQDLAYRMFLISLRKVSPAKKQALFDNTRALSSHWDSVIIETNQNYQQQCLILIEKCELSREKVASASQTGMRSGSSSVFRRSKEFEVLTSEMGIQQLSVERDPYIHSQSRRNHDLDAIHSLHQLQFLGSQVFDDPLRSIDQQFSHRISPDDPYIFEIQQTYCGMGLHYHMPVHSVSEEVKKSLPTGHIHQSNGSVNESKKISNQQQPKVRSDIDPDSDSATTRRKYMTLLKNGLQKRGTVTETKKDSPLLRTITKQNLNLPGRDHPKSSVGGEKISEVQEFDKVNTPEIIYDQKSENTIAQRQPIPNQIASLPNAIPDDFCLGDLQDMLPCFGEHSKLEQKEFLISLLLSPTFQNFLDLAPSFINGEIKPPYQDESIEWAVGLFSNSNLPISERCRIALTAHSDIHQNLEEFIGSPPAPLPPFPPLSQTKMRELSVLQESLLSEVEHILTHSNTLLHHRRNLVTSCEKIKKYLESQKLVAVANIRKLLKTVHARRQDISSLEGLVAATDVFSQLVQTNEFIKAERITQLEERLINLKRILKNIDTEERRKQEFTDASEEVSAAVFAMKDEIKNSLELQSCLRTRSLTDMLLQHFSSPKYQMSFKRTIFTQLRKNVHLQRQVRIMVLERNLKRRIHLLLYYWTKFQKYRLKLRQERKAVSWIKKNQLYKWLERWKVAFDYRQREQLFACWKNSRNQKNALIFWRDQIRWLRARKFNFQQISLKTDSLHKKWIFRAWKNFVESQISASCKGQQKSSLSKLTVAIRQREIDEKKKESLAHHFHLKFLFKYWRDVIISEKIILQDREFVLSSFQMRRQLTDSFKIWYNTSIATIFNRKSKSNKYWRRFKRYASVTKHYNRTKRRSAELYFLNSLHGAFYDWIRFNATLRRSRERNREHAKFCNHRKLIRAFSNWIHVATTKATYRRQLSIAMTKYFFTLMKQSWVKLCLYRDSEKRLKQRKLEWVRLEIEREKLENREVAQDQIQKLDYGSTAEKIGWNELISDDEMESNRKPAKRRRDSIMIPHPKVSKTKLHCALHSWLQFARGKRRLRVAERLILFRVKSRLMNRIFSILLVKWISRCRSRIEEGKKLDEGVLLLQQRSITMKENISVLQQELAKHRIDLDHSRVQLAEQQTSFDRLSAAAVAIEEELIVFRNTIEVKLKEQTKQSDVIKSILFLCKGQNSQPNSLNSTTKDLTQFLSEKICLLSSLEKCNEDAIATSRFKEKEKSKLHEQIREGLSIGQRYNHILQNLIPERDRLEEERRLGEQCLEDCKQKLEHIFDRVQDKLSIDQQEISDLEHEKNEWMRRLDATLSEESFLRDQLTELRRKTSQVDQNIEDSNEALSSRHLLLASENIASSKSVSSLSEKNLTKCSISSSHALKTFIEKSDRPQNEILSPLQNTLKKQLDQMDRDDSSEYLKRITISTTSPPSVTSGPALDFDYGSFHSESSEDLDGISNQIQNISSRIRARLRSPPSV